MRSISESILQKYLTQQHIKITDDSHVDCLKKAVTELKKTLSKKKPPIVAYTLVAIDPNIGDDDPIVQKTESTIIKNWSTFKNNVAASPDKSTTYVRAVILEALNQLSSSDHEIAALVWFTARDVLTHLQLGVEITSITEYLQDVADKTEKMGRKAWGISPSLKLGEFDGGNVAISTPDPVQIDHKSLSAYLKDAMVYSGWRSSADGGENPYQQGQNGWQWPKYAAEESAKGITKVVNSALSKQSKSLTTISESVKASLENYFSQLEPFFEEISSSFVQSIQASNNRSELLWWKQALYSPRSKLSYRQINLIDCVILMAFDLSDQVEPIYPESVDYLLIETQRDVYGDEIDKEDHFSIWLEKFQGLKENTTDLLRDYVTENVGRKTLLEGLANSSFFDNYDFFKETGIKEEAKISLSELTVWLFHCLQADKIYKAKTK